MGKERGITFTAENAAKVRAGTKTMTRRILPIPKWLQRMGPVLEHAWPDLLWGSTPGLHVPCSRDEDGSEIDDLTWPCEGKAPKTGRACSCGKSWETVQRLPNPWGFMPPMLYDSPEKLEGVPVRLWVREPWALSGGDGGELVDSEGRQVSDERLAARLYKADSTPGDYGMATWPDGTMYGGKWRLAMFMPRWASRTLLEVTAVRIERLQDISEEDAIAEGVTGLWSPVEGDSFYGAPGEMMYPTASRAFRSLWDALYKGKPEKQWSANPWVTATTFRRIEP